MTPSPSAVKSKTSPGVVLADFFQHIRFSNPFGMDRVTEPYGREVDIEAIHAREFKRLTQLAGVACREGRGIGVVLWGEAGVGKSHLLARVRRWSDSVPADRRDPQAYYIFLHNIQAGPERLPRYILKCVIKRLTNSLQAGFTESDLCRLVSNAVRMALPPGAKSANPDDARRYFYQLIEAQLQEDSQRSLEDRDIYQVLFEFYLDAVKAKRLNQPEVIAALAVRWLSGDALEPDEAKQLNLPRRSEQGDEIELADNQAIERVLIVLMRLARLRKQAFMLCFDQVENLNQNQLLALTQFSHSLLDSAANLLLVTSGVQHDLLDFKEKGWIRNSSWDRIAQEEVYLSRVDPGDARRVLEGRLVDFLDAYIGLPEVKQFTTVDKLFPLGEKWFNKRVGEALELRPRDVIAWARARWREQLEALESMTEIEWLVKWPIDEILPPPPDVPLEVLIDAKVEARLQEQVRRRGLEPSTLPPDASNMAGLVESLLTQCLKTEHGYSITEIDKPLGRKGQQPTYQLVIQERAPDGKQVQSGVCIVVTANATSLAGSLRRLDGDPQPPQHVLLVTEQRQPLKLAKTGETYWKKLKQRGEARFKTLELTFNEYAGLDALQAVVGQARSGDLDIDLPRTGSRAVSAAEVVASHHRCDRYRKHRLLSELLTEVIPPPPEPCGPELDQLELKQFIMARLALTQGCSTLELAHKYAEDHRAKLPPQLDLKCIRLQLEEAAKVLHGQGKLLASPMDDQLFLLNRPGA